METYINCIDDCLITTQTLVWAEVQKLQETN